MVEDTDEMFMRNRNRSSKTWQKLEQLDRSEFFFLLVSITDHDFLLSCTGIDISEKEVSGSEEDEDDNLTPRRRKRTKKESAAPAWQKSQELAR